MNRTAVVCTSITSLALLGAAALLAAGPLNPPAGPVASSYKTLTEVEPRVAINQTNTPGDANSTFRITVPGSYYLTANVTGSSGKHGIEIASSGVTIDLNGFELTGVAGSLSGVSVSVSNLENLTVVNGSVRGWGLLGVDMGSFSPTSCRVERIQAKGNQLDGIAVGTSSSVINCVANGNVRSGITASSSCLLTGCISNNNGTGASTGHGISADSSSTVSHCTVDGNGRGAGGGHGISVGQTCIVHDCRADQNGQGSTTTNDGINASSGSSVIHCNATLNGGDGIQTAYQCIVLENNCIANATGGDGAGIHSTGYGSRIEGNNCVSAARGIDVDSAPNFICKNTCSGATTNWDVVSGNKILVVIGTSAGAVSGNSGGTAPGSTDPNANFTY